jgi:hypothetical protein
MKLKILNLVLILLPSVMLFSCSEEPPVTPIQPVTGQAPSEPRSVTVYSLDNTASLRWEAPASNGGAYIMQYNIYRGTASGSYSLIGSTGSGSQTYLDTGVANGTQYFYTLTAVNAAGESGRSSEASVIPGGTPSAPLDLTVTTGNTQVLLRWHAPVHTGGFTLLSYKLYRYTQALDTVVQTLSPSDTSYTDHNLINGKEYYYSLRAVNLVGEGSPSNTVAVIPVQTTNDPNVFLFYGRQMSYSSTEGASSGINLLTGRVMAETNTSRDIQLNYDGGSFNIKSSHLQGIQQPGYETNFYSSLVSPDMQAEVFDTLSRISDPDDTLTAGDFPFSITTFYGAAGSFAYPLQGHPVFGFYLKGKHDAGLNNNTPIFGILRVDNVQPSGSGYAITVSFKINIQGRNRFY